MTLYHVYIDRETRQPSRNVKAGSPEEAGHIAADLPSQDASVSEDRDGETFGARVDVAGDDAFARSVMLRGRAVAERSPGVHGHPRQGRRDAMTDDSILEGIRCPRCGNTERFSIACTTLADVTGDGAEPRDVEWSDDSLTVCPVCGTSGQLKSFRDREGVPPDPEGMNDKRSAWAAGAVAAFMDATGTDEADAVCDLVADLMHWCDRHGYDFARELARANDHYAAETLGGDSTD